jgi:hypothetical protein
MFWQQPLGDHRPAVEYCQYAGVANYQVRAGVSLHPWLDHRAESPKNPVSPWITQSELLTNMAQALSNDAGLRMET